MKVFPWAEVESAQARRKGRSALFSIRVNQRNIRFQIELKESRSLVEACSIFLGSRFSSSIQNADFRIGDPPAYAGTVLAGLLLLISLAGLWWSTPPVFGQEDYGIESALAHSIFPWTAVIALLSTFFLFGQWLKKPSGRVAGVEPFRSRPLGIVLRLVGLGVFLAGWLVPGLALRIVDITSGPNIGILHWVESMLELYLGALLLYVGYRIGLPRSAPNDNNDERPPILYLRSFGDDGRNSFNPDGFFAKMLGLRPFELLKNFGALAHVYPPRMVKLAFGFTADTAEEQLGNYFKKIGPFVAIGKPGERLVTGGAKRLYVGHDEWQDRVLSLMERSRAVVLQPAATKGIWWEIQQALEKVGPRRLILCVANFEASAQDYSDFRQRFEQLTGSPLPHTTGHGHFVFFKDETWNAQELPSAPGLADLGSGYRLGKDPETVSFPSADSSAGSSRRLRGECEENEDLASRVCRVGPLEHPAHLATHGLWQGTNRLYNTALADGGLEIEGSSPNYRWELGKGWERTNSADGIVEFTSEAR